MTLNQINLTYIPVEDRLMLRINTSSKAELKFWLTRAVVINLLSGLSQMECLIYDPLLWKVPDSLALQAVQAFQHAIPKGAEPEGFAQDAESYPLGETPVLVTKIRIRNENTHAVCIFELADRQVMTINLSPEIVRNVYRLLCDMAKIADWNPPKDSLSIIKFPFFKARESSTVH